MVPDELSRISDHLPALNMKSLGLNEIDFLRRIKESCELDKWASQLITTIRDGKEPDNQKVAMQGLAIFFRTECCFGSAQENVSSTYQRRKR